METTKPLFLCEIEAAASPRFASNMWRYCPLGKQTKRRIGSHIGFFFSDCGGLGETLEEMKSSVSWTSSEELQIALDINRGTSRGDEVNLNGYADGLKVRVTYVVRPRP
jgi:hypothetical protein